MRTEEKKLVFTVGENVRVQCPKSLRWNIRGQIQSVRVYNEGTIVSYDIKLENGHVTTRYLTKDIPEKAVEEVENSIHVVVDIPAHGGASGFTESRIQTRIMKRRF